MLSLLTQSAPCIFIPVNGNAGIVFRFLFQKEAYGNSIFYFLSIPWFVIVEYKNRIRDSFAVDSLQATRQANPGSNINPFCKEAAVYR